MATARGNCLVISHFQKRQKVNVFKIWVRHIWEQAFEGAKGYYKSSRRIVEFVSQGYWPHPQHTQVVAEDQLAAREFYCSMCRCTNLFVRRLSQSSPSQYHSPPVPPLWEFSSPFCPTEWGCHPVKTAGTAHVPLQLILSGFFLESTSCPLEHSWHANLQKTKGHTVGIGGLPTKTQQN